MVNSVFSFAKNTLTIVGLHRYIEKQKWNENYAQFHKNKIYISEMVYHILTLNARLNVSFFEQVICLHNLSFVRKFRSLEMYWRK